MATLRPALILSCAALCALPFHVGASGLSLDEAASSPCDKEAAELFPKNLYANYTDVSCVGRGSGRSGDKVFFSAEEKATKTRVVLKIHTESNLLAVQEMYRDCQYANRLHQLGCEKQGNMSEAPKFEQPGAAHIMRCFGTNAFAALGRCPDKKRQSEVPYVILEDAGEELPRFIQRALQEGRWSIKIVRSILRAMVESLDYLARQGFNHGDFHEGHLTIRWQRGTEREIVVDRGDSGPSLLSLDQQVAVSGGEADTTRRAGNLHIGISNDADVEVKLIDLGAAEVSVNNDILHAGALLCFMMLVPPCDFRVKDGGVCREPGPRADCARRIRGVIHRIATDQRISDHHDPAKIPAQIGEEFAEDLNRDAEDSDGNPLRPTVKAEWIADIWEEMLSSKESEAFLHTWVNMLEGNVTSEELLKSELIGGAPAQHQNRQAEVCRQPEGDPAGTPLAKLDCKESAGCDSKAIEALSEHVNKNKVEVFKNECSSAVQALPSSGVFPFCAKLAAADKNMEQCVGNCQYERRWHFMGQWGHGPLKAQCGGLSLIPMDAVLLCSDFFLYSLAASSWDEELEPRPEGLLSEAVPHDKQGPTAIWLDYGIKTCPLELAHSYVFDHPDLVCAWYYTLSVISAWLLLQCIVGVIHWNNTVRERKGWAKDVHVVTAQSKATWIAGFCGCPKRNVPFYYARIICCLPMEVAETFHIAGIARYFIVFPLLTVFHCLQCLLGPCCCCGSVIWAFWRGTLRKMRGLEQSCGTVVTDFLAVCCCPWFAAMQEAHEVDEANKEQSAGHDVDISGEL